MMEEQACLLTFFTARVQGAWRNQEENTFVFHSCHEDEVKMTQWRKLTLGSWSISNVTALKSCRTKQNHSKSTLLKQTPPNELEVWIQETSPLSKNMWQEELSDWFLTNYIHIVNVIQEPVTAQLTLMRTCGRKCGLCMANGKRAETLVSTQDKMSGSLVS